MRRMLAAAAALLALSLLAWPPRALPGQEAARGSAATAAPTGAALEALTSEVASQLRCPVCRGLSIEDSGSDLAQEARALIKERLAAGESPEAVKAYFVQKYGEWILLSPPKRGFTLLVWVLPVLALLGGAGVLVAAFRRWLPRADEPASAAGGTADAEAIP